MKKFILLFACLSLLNGCSTIASLWSGDVELQSQLIVNIEAAQNINPNVKGKPSPVEVRIYQLADSEAFNRADFLQLYADEQGVLKTGMLSTRHLQSILPGEKRREVIPLRAETKFIAVIAGFADYREAKNKALFQPIILGATAITIELDGLNLSVTGEEE
ncbi:MAG: type VI secretion system lipoprotein TssJ [Shewanella sp.]|nr:type VI secretion system lipoprotein TssJ [Shewanella sp.]